jgi:hypothetical protein
MLVVCTIRLRRRMVSVSLFVCVRQSCQCVCFALRVVASTRSVKRWVDVELLARSSRRESVVGALGAWAELASCEVT